MGKRKEFVDLVGHRFDKLVVTEFAGVKKYTRSYINVWKCRCNCGNEVTVLENTLMRNTRHSCGCHRLNDLTGRRFGRLLVLNRSENNTNYNKPKWICQCDCGNIVEIAGNCLTTGWTRSCGCLKAELDHKRTKTHGDTVSGKTTRLYTIWSDIKQRCLNKNNPAYPYYGGRGIRICNEWAEDYSIFREWAYNNGYNDAAGKYECTIDRIDTNKDYCPDNCRWVSMKIQGNNTRRNHIITFNNESHTISEWADMTGIKYKTIMSRLKLNWSIKDTLTIPSKSVHRYKEATDEFCATPCSQ